MPSQADVELVRVALANLSKRAQADFMAVWNALPDQHDFAAVRKVLESFWPDLIGHYGAMASVLAADQAQALMADWKLAGAPDPVRGVDPERANARMRWAIGLPSATGSLLTVLDELVKQPYRSTIAAAAKSGHVGWARVPSGHETCEFCSMLAGRGAVYRSRATAGEQRKFHGDCDCVAVLVRDEADYPSSYEPDALMQRYLDARAAADSGSTSAILAAARAAHGTH